ncbi:unnamed protein product [Didymodactylos carnosus]|uniref:MATH domain-containing protein n=1 Tax=Didymodactylos carnosus TaxID=1234261 RepID=A0A815FMY9_9BILA|nr:unnamed protein product [Didymodactylos carnosus]CAF1327748.1 unnamed protein product [Didymodactylos carnosus]CAF3808056.1 unnamed protein product [Didymodactylos carnosus]CAF4178751.1 unnamed protein product [Didymodactylos carnosus]
MLIESGSQSTTGSSGLVKGLYTEVQNLYKTLSILTRGTETLSTDTNRISMELLGLNNLIETVYNDMNELKKSNGKEESSISAIKLSQETTLQELSNIKQKVEEKELASSDGTFIWIITQVMNKMADAQSDRQPSILSPPFYSSPVGYKMRARLYLNGDGNAKRTHISLFFVIMKGEHDAILTWPFDYKVTFCLLDQSGQNQHISDSFRPDTKSNSFQRPRSEMNIASGIPKFYPLPIIQQNNNSYVRDDTMFIKVMVDFANMPKTMLPYTLSLNPGLPDYIQQSLIIAEAKKRENVTASIVTRTE